MNLTPIFNTAEDFNSKKNLITIILELFLRMFLTDIIMSLIINLIGFNTLRM